MLALTTFPLLQATLTLARAAPQSLLPQFRGNGRSLLCQLALNIASLCLIAVPPLARVRRNDTFGPLQVRRLGGHVPVGSVSIGSGFMATCVPDPSQ